MCIYIYIYTYIWSLWHRVYMVLRMATQPGRTLGLSPTEPRFGRRTCARACARQPVRIRVRAHLIHVYVYSIPDTTTVCTVHGESVRVSRRRARAYQYRRAGRPIHRGTKPKAINLFARQPATRHCVYPHVNHYVRLRDIEPDTRPVSQRISNSPFPAVGQNA